MTRIATCLWFDKGGEEAARFYCSLIPNSEVTNVARFNPEDPENTLVEYKLNGVPYQHLSAGPHFTQSEAASIVVITEDQEETDRYWDALTADGGRESMCGWLKDRWGVNWQVFPRKLTELTMAPGEAGERARQAMFKMKRIDLAAVQAAHDGVAA